MAGSFLVVGHEAFKAEPVCDSLPQAEIEKERSDP